MRKIGNIVSSNLNIEINDRFNVVTSINSIIPDLPTLIIGLFEVTKIKDSDEIDLVNRKLDNKTYWTFSKTERRREYEIDLYNFIIFSYRTLVKDVKYVFLDFINRSEKEIKKIKDKINNSARIATYVHDDKMLYICADGILFGIDLELCEYMAIDTDLIKKHFNKKSSSILQKNEIIIEYKEDIENMNNDVKYLPFLYSIDNE